jgi:PAS domain S-box-containing protein
VKIYLKTGIIVSIALIVLIFIFLGASKTLVLGGFSEVEMSDAAKDMERIVDVLVDEINLLDNFASEWASREETRTIVKRTYINHLTPPNNWDELDDQVFQRLEVNFILVHDATGKLIAGKGLDLEKGENIPLPDGLQTQVGPGMPLAGFDNTNSSVMGIMLLEDIPLLVTSHPVLADENEGSIIGSFVMAKYLDEKGIQHLSTMTSLPVQVISYEEARKLPDSGAIQSKYDPKIPFIIQTDSDTYKVDAPIEIVTLSENALGGYCLIKDIDNKPAFVITTELPRSIYAQGKVNTFTLLVYMFGGFLLFSLLIIILLERTVLSRLSFLNAKVNSIGSKKDFSARISLPGDDEVSSLAKAINWMLADLEDSQLSLRDKLSQTEERYRLFFNTGNDMVLVHSVNRDGSFGKFMEVNEAACKQLGYTREDLLQLHPKSIFPPSQMEKSPEILKEILEKGRILYETEFITKSGWVLPVEINAHFFEHMGWTAVLAMARDITERKDVEKVKKEAFCQIEKNMEQFAILNDHIRNPLQAIVGLSLLNAEDEEVTDKILGQAEIINGLVDQLDQGWIESEKIRDWLRKYYGFD